jgi:hypothetical protein
LFSVYVCHVLKQNLDVHLCIYDPNVVPAFVMSAARILSIAVVHEAFAVSQDKYSDNALKVDTFASTTSFTINNFS